jgi:hypothetical protein
MSIMAITIFRRDGVHLTPQARGGMLMPPMRKVDEMDEEPAEDWEQFLRREHGSGYFYVNRYGGNIPVETLFKGWV